MRWREEGEEWEGGEKERRRLFFFFSKQQHTPHNPEILIPHPNSLSPHPIEKNKNNKIVPGLDEGIKSMRAGGLRRVYVPGPLSFPKGLPSGPGRPRVPPASPVVFDVELLYIPGLDDE